METPASGPKLTADQAARASERPSWVPGWLRTVALTVVGPAEEPAQRQDVMRRAVLTVALIAVLGTQRSHVPAWPAVVIALAAAFTYNIYLAYLVFVAKQFLLARVLAFILDATLMFVALTVVLKSLGEANSASDIWVAMLLFIGSGGFALAPVGSLIYTALGTGAFTLGTLLYFPADSQYHEQLPLRVAFFVAFGLLALGAAQEMDKRRKRVLEQNNALAESTRQLEDKSQQLERALALERERARRDPLTGALNHGALIQELRSVIDEQSDSSVTAIVMADVDGLKAINDVHGHTVGDEVLVSVAQALSQDGVVVGRYGGDEFVAIIRDCSPEAAEQYQKAVLDRFKSASVTDPDTGARVSVSVSLGTALYPAEADAVEGLIQASDSAMYAMKRTRRFSTSVTEQPLGTNRAAELVGQLAPLLAAPGNVDEKLQLVSKRLSGIAGYDAVNVTMFAPVLTKAPGPRAANTFAKVPQHLVEAWNADQRGDMSEEPHPIRLMLERTRRPLIFDNPWNDEAFTEQQRDLLRAADLKSVLVAPLIWKDDVAGFLGVASKAAGAFGSSDGQFLASVAMHVSAIVQMATLVTELEASTGELKLAHEETVLLLAASAEAHDQTTGRHLHNVRRVAELLAEALGHSDADGREIGLAAVMHDIGKVRVPDDILRKPAELSPDERDVMRSHTVWGAEFLSGRRGFELAAAVARSHHERWDGAGYPDHLTGSELPEAAAIATVADAFDAMLSVRPYKRARTVEQAIRELSQCSGKQFSPRVVDALLQLYASGKIDTVLREQAQAA